MLLASETSIQLTNALEKLIDSGIQLGERVLGALIIFIIGKFLINWLNRLFARILEKRKSLLCIVFCFDSRSAFDIFFKNNEYHCKHNNALCDFGML